MKKTTCPKLIMRMMSLHQELWIFHAKYEMGLEVCLAINGVEVCLAVNQLLTQCEK